jgi:hypothetical protein
VYCADPNSDEIGLSLRSDSGESIRISCPQSELAGRQYVLKAAAPVLAGDVDLRSFGLFSDPFNYLHAERIGPR